MSDMTNKREDERGVLWSGRLPLADSRGIRAPSDARLQDDSSASNVPLIGLVTALGHDAGADPIWQVAAHLARLLHAATSENAALAERVRVAEATLWKERQECPSCMTWADECDAAKARLREVEQAAQAFLLVADRDTKEANALRALLARGESHEETVDPLDTLNSDTQQTSGR